jgi:DNA-binding protein H-NS
LLADKLSPSIRKQKALSMSKDLAELSLTELKKLQRKIETELQKRERTSRSQLLKSMEKLAQEAATACRKSWERTKLQLQSRRPKRRKRASRQRRRR